VTDPSRDRTWRFLHEMIRIRRFEEKCAELYSAGHIRGFLHLSIGEEAVSVGVMHALAADDAIVATYREHGHALARGIPMDTLMAEMYGKQTGCSRGRGGSMHVFDAAKRFYGGNAIVGGGLPIAVGLALAATLQRQPGIVACFFGDGAVAEGEFHESLNLAALWRLPVLFVCENNLYAMGTRVDRAQSQTDLAAKARSYRIDAAAVDGMDVLAVADAAAHAVASVRSDGTPRFLELRTYRFRAHSMFDPDLYRDKSEIDAWKQRDPISTLSRTLVERDVATAALVTAVEASVADEIDQAVQFADESDWEPAADLLKDVYTR